MRQPPEEIVSGLVGLGHWLVAARSVVADGRSADQNRRAPGDAVKGRHQAACRQKPALGEGGLSRRSPAPLGDGLAGQVDHRVGAIGRLGPPPRLCRPVATSPRGRLEPARVVRLRLSSTRS